ncbi:MAG: isoaspartyl peptidase/L-asparaginase [Myxococcales bacterium]|nr:isoaspartyl peptidase/L-asparaginase [Myxococcales bacterium]
MAVTQFWSTGAADYSVLVHGGAGQRATESLPAARAGCEAAADAAAEILEAGGSALDAVQRAVQVMEDDPQFNAGTGGALNADGGLELDASIMEGSGLRAGAVCALPPFQNPVAIARAVLEAGPHVLYAGAGAEAFALAHGFERAEPGRMITERARQQLHEALARGKPQLTTGGTVGAVAQDVHGALAAATSTGGLAGKAVGRVGDSPIPGAGNLADDGRGACSATGDGDGILRVVLAERVLASLEAAVAPERAVRRALVHLEARVGATGGLIVVAPDGRLALARSTPSMTWAARQAGGSAWSGV